MITTGDFHRTTVGMNNYLASDTTNLPYRVFLKQSELADPSQLFVFLDFLLGAAILLRQRGRRPH
jgi:hypothetical protein